MAQANRGRRVLGVMALLIGVVGAAALWLLAGKRYDDAVANLAPAPIGCEATLVFDRTGTYTIFVETKGRVGEIDGDCEADDRSYDLGDTDPPTVSLTIVDGDGDEVDLDQTEGPTYDRSGARGSGFRTVEIDAIGDYVLTADADDAEVMIRVGRDPATGVTAMRVGAVAVLIAGLIVGVVLLASAQRRRATTGPPLAGSPQPWPHVAGRPPPTAPPYANPPVPPPYAVPSRPGAPAAPTGSPGGPPGGGRPLPPPRPPQSRTTLRGDA